VTQSDGKVFVTGSRVLACLDTVTGEAIWTNYGDLNAHAPYPVSGLAPRAGLGYFEDEGKTVAVRLDSGEVAWVRQLKELSGETARERGTSTPLATEEGVYFHHRSHLRKLDPQTGEEHWTVRTGEGFNYVSTPAWAEGKVVVATGARIVAVNAATGDIAWISTTRHADATSLGKHQNLLNGSTPAIANGHVFVGSDDGYLYTLSLTDGVKIWEYDTGTPIKASPALSGNLLVISNFAGQLLAFVPEQSAGTARS
jgi:outer membrane protein assembly factor BamB